MSAFIMNKNGNTTLLELDTVTSRLLMRLAEMWGVTAEEAMYRAVAQACCATSSLSKEHWLEAFKELQRSLSLTRAKAAEWQDSIRGARR